MFHIGFCDYNRFEQDNMSVHRPNGLSDYLFLLFLMPFYVYFENQTICTNTNACILYPPGEPQHYQAANVFKNSFLHFTADYDFVSEFHIPVGTVIYPKGHDTINRHIRNIRIESINKTAHYERKIDCLLEQILIEISREIHYVKSPTHNAELYLQFQDIRLALIYNCENDWTTEKICRLANMEKSQLYSYYSSFFNTTPKADIICARIEKAENLLTNENLQIQQVAEMCGYKNVSHFTRYFKKRNGYTPAEYAKISHVRQRV